MTDTLERPTISEADEQALLDSIDRWLEKKVAPVAAKYEQADEYPTELVQDMCEMGLFGALIEPQYGGLGLPAITYSRIVARISEEWMSLTGFFNSHLMMALIVQKFGTPAQKDHWLPQVRHRRAARRPGAHRARRRHRPAGHPHHRPARRRRLPDQRLEALDHQRHRGRHPGGAGEDQSGRRAAPPRHVDADRADPRSGDAQGGGRRLARPQAAEARLPRHRHRRRSRFDDAPVDARLGLVGGEEGKGFLMATGGLEIGRVNVAARGVGIARRALKEAVAYAQIRTTMGKPIAQHQAIQLKLGEMAAKTRAVRAAGRGRRPRLRPRRPRRPGGRHGQVVRHRDRLRGRHRVDAHPRRLRLLEGVSRSNASTATRRC